MNTDINQLEEIVSEAVERARKIGFREGLAVAEQIRCWLTRSPDHKWQQEVRGWADKAIDDAKKQLGDT